MTDDHETLDRVLGARFSCRGYLPDPVPQQVIARIAASARRAPSWCNAQPWELIVTRAAQTEAFRGALRTAARTTPPAPDLAWPTGYSGVYRDRRRECGWQLYEAVGVEKGDRAGSAAQMMRNYDLFDAPHVAIVHSPAELGPYGAMDCGGFVTAFMLAAQSLGVASIAQAAVAAQAPALRQHFDMAPDRLILCAISFGYPDPDHPANGFRTARAEVDDFIDWRG